MNSARPLEGKVALVTGAASGIGRATCLRLALAGARVAATDVDPSVASVAAQIASAGGLATSHELDVTDEAAWISTVEGVVTGWKRLDVLVSSAKTKAGRTDILNYIAAILTKHKRASG